jgi:nickel/cobalt transporter (NicO) family protein
VVDATGEKPNESRFVNPMERLRAPEGLFDPSLVRLIDDPETGGLIAILGLVLATGVGAVHALGPGHGKALIGAYLVGSRGRARDAVALGALVAAMHTGSVLILAFVLRATRQATGSERLESALTVIAASGIVALGLWMLYDRWRNVRRAPSRLVLPQTPPRAAAVVEHRHVHDRNEAPAHHHHGHGHSHSHELPDGVAPLSRAGIAALAGSGGLLPSPVASLVLLTAIATGRTGYGVALVFAFSIGLAGTLTAVGLTILWGRATLDRHAHRPGLALITAQLPLASALTVLAGGLILAWGAIAAL